MTDSGLPTGAVQGPVTQSAGPARAPQTTGSGANLADILERVLDKGIVIAGDIKVNLLDIELLTIKLRLLVASVDKAKEMGIDWWEHDPSLSASGPSKLSAENERLRERVAELESEKDSTGLPRSAHEPAQVAERSANLEER